VERRINSGIETVRALDQARRAGVTHESLLKFGLGGSLIAIVCCFTPLLAVLLGVIGLSILVGWIDYVLLPMLALFLGVTAYALWRRRQTP
jgi:mercuric ion transport protein